MCGQKIEQNRKVRKTKADNCKFQNQLKVTNRSKILGSGDRWLIYLVCTLTCPCISVFRSSFLLRVSFYQSMQEHRGKCDRCILNEELLNCQKIVRKCLPMSYVVVETLQINLKFTFILLISVGWDQSLKAKIFLIKLLH